MKRYNVNINGINLDVFIKAGKVYRSPDGIKELSIKDNIMTWLYNHDGLLIE